jgi:hypothetical protein|tara:strand:+ start:625 stop:1011 length:387 start_codon:yes stop_codon:yes gene_type:complete
VPNVFIVNSSAHDYSDAERYGSLVVMSEGAVNKFNVSAMFRTFEKYLNKSSHDDFLLSSGPAVMQSIACAMFAARHSRLNLLTWRYEGGDKPDHYVHQVLIFNIPEGKPYECHSSNSRTSEELGELRE